MKTFIKLEKLEPTIIDQFETLELKIQKVPEEHKIFSRKESLIFEEDFGDLFFTNLKFSDLTKKFKDGEANQKQNRGESKFFEMLAQKIMNKENVFRVKKVCKMKQKQASKKHITRTPTKPLVKKFLVS